MPRGAPRRAAIATRAEWPPRCRRSLAPPGRSRTRRSWTRRARPEAPGRDRLRPAAACAPRAAARRPRRAAWPAAEGGSCVRLAFVGGGGGGRVDLDLVLLGGQERLLRLRLARRRSRCGGPGRRAPAASEDRLLGDAEQDVEGEVDQ